MLFPTGEFLFLYLPVVAASFFLIARLAGARPAAFFLVLASLYFYASWRPVHTVLLLISIAINYGAGGLILTARVRGDAQRARMWLIAAVVVNLGLLGYFKYANFFLDTLNAVTEANVHLADIALPLGISFFTFTQIAYLADVHAGKAVERSPLRFALFVTYFPHLVAGPVLHHAQMMPQFAEPSTYVPRLHNMVLGFAFVVVGLAKKVLIADSFAPTANAVFDAAKTGAIDMATAWSGVLSYTVQIYFDFSGYSDMAVGLSLLFNVRLPYNFNSPYKARSIIDFWRRWHITLSNFLRDYLYVPLGGNRKGKVRRYVNLALTMLLGGLWHGASWTFVIWGGLHGLYLVINHWWRWVQTRMGWAREPGQKPNVVTFVLSSALTLLAVITAWVFFRAETFSGAMRFVMAMYGQGGEVAGAGPAALAWWWAAVFLLVAKFAPNSQDMIDGFLQPRLEKIPEGRARPLMSASVGACIVIILCVALISESRNVTEFIYFNF
jgi:alginate O-acetyltransferase complex protein AlgI